MSDERGAADTDRPTAHDIAARLIAFGEVRTRVFEPFAMPVNDIAWQLLLRCFVAQERGLRTSIYRLCDDMSVPKSVSVRWLRALRGCGMVEYDEEAGALSAAVRLSTKAESVLRDLLDA